MSPIRLPFGESRLQITAGPPKNIQISTTAASARNRACRKRSGPPSSDTTRRPIAILPSERPRVAVSKTSGYPTSTSTVKMIRIAVLSASSNCVRVAAHNITPRR
jgi:hypothetical protein